MLKRLFKTILILTICFVLTIPSSAAISVSDGSAFMTKTEFMADINNLSSRVAQLEITLDGTLDDKVSSYLEQKGFWKAKEQTFATSGSSPLNQMLAVMPYNVSATSGSTKNEVELNRLTLVEELTASGMCLLNLAFKASTTATANMRWGYMGNKGGTYYSDNNIMLVANFYERLNGSTTDDIKATLILGNNLGQIQKADDTQYVNIIMLPATEILMPTMFFVTKGSKLLWALRESYAFTDLSGAPNKSDNLSGIDVYIRSCVVY